VSELPSSVTTGSRCPRIPAFDFTVRSSTRSVDRSQDLSGYRILNVHGVVTPGSDTAYLITSVRLVLCVSVRAILATDTDCTCH
jgi:hypothetical protein